ncbi:MAG: hypothetical protein U1E45_03580 [Geminicoccaceae bacterium]
MPKLPVLKLVRHAYLDLYANWQGLLQVGGIWLLLVWALMMLTGSPALDLLANIALMLAVAAVAVAWHRHILENAPLTARVAPLDTGVFRYLCYTILFGVVIGLVPLFVFGALGAATGPGQVTLSLPGVALGAAFFIAAIYIAMRLQLVFPAAAIGDDGIGFARSWDITQGNGWRLCLGLFLTTVPVAIVMLALTYLLGWLAASTGSIVAQGLASLAIAASSWLQAPLIAAFLSYAYLFFRQRSTSQTA